MVKTKRFMPLKLTISKQTVKGEKNPMFLVLNQGTFITAFKSEKEARGFISKRINKMTNLI